MTVFYNIMWTTDLLASKYHEIHVTKNRYDCNHTNVALSFNAVDKNALYEIYGAQNILNLLELFITVRINSSSLFKT